MDYFDSWSMLGSFEEAPKIPAWPEADHKPKLIRPTSEIEQVEVKPDSDIAFRWLLCILTFRRIQRPERRESIKVEMLKEALGKSNAK